MFTQHIPRAGSSVGKSTPALKRVGAAIGVIALSSGLALASPVAANAALATTSYAQGQFLSGSLGGIDLSAVVELQAAEAYNDGSEGKVTSKDPLNASVLQSTEVAPPAGSIQVVELSDYVDAGAVNQYAEADRNGVSLGASGAVGDDGGIGAGLVGEGTAGDLEMDIDPALDDSYADVLTDLSLTLEAVSAQAKGNLDIASGDYEIEGAILTFTSPAIDDLTAKVSSSLDEVDAKLLELGGDDGLLGDAIDRILDPLLGAVGSSANVSVSIGTDLQAAVQSLLDGQYGNGAVRFNLQTGTVSVDLAALLGGSLNDLPPNTEILSDAVIGQVLQGITDTVSTLADQIVDKVKMALDNAHVEVHADLDLLTGQAPGQETVCHDIQIPIIGDIVSDGGLLGGLLGGVTGGTVTQGVIGYTTKTVCELVSHVLPDLHSTVNVDIEGTVGQLLDGVAAKADASISLLDGTVNAAIDVDALIDGVADGLLDGLFDSDGAVAGLVDSLNLGLVTPAVDGLLGDSSVNDALTDALSIKVNVQELDTTGDGSMFTETAVRVAVGDLATVNVAAATVGPNITTIVDPGCTVNCGPTDPGCVTNCTPGDPNPPVTAAGPNGLAMTGVGIATLIAIILALLAAGAYLAREGYRRNHPQSL